MDAPTDNGTLYREFVHGLALLALHYPAYLAHSDPQQPSIPVLTLETPHGQLCYHVPGADADDTLWAHVRWVHPNDAQAAYDGHTMAEKHERIRARIGSFPVMVNT